MVPTNHLRSYEEVANGKYKEIADRVALLKACAKSKDLHRGGIVHADILKSGWLEKIPFVAHTLINMYAKCGALSKAMDVLEELSERNVVSWNALISGYAQLGQGGEALVCFKQMQQEGLCANAVTYASILKACGSIGALEMGEHIHSEVIRQELLYENAKLGGALVDMYVKCGSLATAKEVLEGLPDRDVASWNVLIAGYTQGQYGEEALECFELMQRDDTFPDVITFVSILGACGCLGALDRGKAVHQEIHRQQLLTGNVVLGNALVDMYAKCGALATAKEVLQDLCLHDVVSWNALIAGYVHAEQNKEALKCLVLMQCNGVFPNVVTYACILKACGSMKALDEGEKIHAEIQRRGLLNGHSMLGCALVDMYAKCGVFCKAKEVLEGLHARDVVSWNALIAGYTQGRNEKEAVNCFEQMQHEGLSPNASTFACILKACGSTGALERGEKIHTEIARQGFLGQYVVIGNALVDMYAKCREFSKAKEVLEGLVVRNVVSWNALVTGYAQEEHAKEALDCFDQMQWEGLFPDAITFSCLLKACGSVGVLDRGEKIHSEIIRHEFLNRNAVLGGALVDMYAKSGALAKAYKVLESLPMRSVISWNALMAGYAQREHGKESLDCFEQMQCEGLSPDDVTFLCVLTACSHSCLLYEGLGYFDLMTKNYNITPSLEHHTCMVDLFGQIGLLDQAIAAIGKMPSSNHLPVWSAFLNACRKWGNMKLGSWAFEHLIQILSV